MSWSIYVHDTISSTVKSDVTVATSITTVDKLNGERRKIKNIPDMGIQLMELRYLIVVLCSRGSDGSFDWITRSTFKWAPMVFFFLKWKLQVRRNLILCYITLARPNVFRLQRRSVSKATGLIERDAFLSTFSRSGEIFSSILTRIKIPIYEQF